MGKPQPNPDISDPDIASLQSEIEQRRAKKIKEHDDMLKRAEIQGQKDRAALKDLSSGKDRAKYASKFSALSKSLKDDLQGGIAITIEKYLLNHDERSLGILESQLRVLSILESIGGKN
jgi:hypothetical protein